MPGLPKLPKFFTLPDPDRVLLLIDKTTHAVDTALNLVDKAAEQFDRAASRLETSQPKPPETAQQTQPPPAPTQTEGESCPVCSGLTDLKEFLARRKVEKALTELETGQGDRAENVQTVKKYIEGEDIG